MQTTKHNSQAGFSLLEMMVVVAILLVVMGAVMQQITTVQQRYRTEEQRIDIAQESREFFDQIVRDLHQQGYPNRKMYGAGQLMNPIENDQKNAVGIVKFAYDEIWFEGDVDGDGTVDVVNYRLQTDGVLGSCPCRVSRSVVVKANATAPMAQTISYNTELQDVVNSGGANNSASNVAGYTIAGTIYKGGTAYSNDVIYATYKNANVFTAFDAAGNPVAPGDYNGGPLVRAALKNIKTIRINLNLLARQQDLQTGVRPAVSLTASVRLPAN